MSGTQLNDPTNPPRVAVKLRSVLLKGPLVSYRIQAKVRLYVLKGRITLCDHLVSQRERTIRELIVCASTNASSTVARPPSGPNWCFGTYVEGSGRNRKEKHTCELSDVSISIQDSATTEWYTASKLVMKAQVERSMPCRVRLPFVGELPKAVLPRINSTKDLVAHASDYEDSEDEDDVQRRLT